MTQTLQSVTSKRISRVNFLSRREIAELPNLLMPDEQVLGIVSGFYTTGPATLCITSRRLLLIDKKLIRLNYEDIRFEAIKEVSYSHQAFMASVRFFYAGRVLQFKSWYKSELRSMAQFAQHRMFEVRDAKVNGNLQTDDVEMLNQPTDYQEPEAIELPEAKQEPVQQTPETVSFQRTAALYQAGPQLERYLVERIARWRRASRFIENLPTAAAERKLEKFAALPKLPSLEANSFKR